MGLGLCIKVREIARGEKICPLLNVHNLYIRMDLYCFIVFHFKSKAGSKSISLIGYSSLLGFIFLIPIYFNHAQNINHCIRQS